MDVHPRLCNYYALTLAICNWNYSVDRAISYFSPSGGERQSTIPGRPRLDEQEAEEMIRLQAAGMSNSEIGQIYGITKSAVSHRIHRYQKRARR